MTIASTSGTQKTINELVRLAYVLAGLLEESQALADVGGGGLGRSFLDVMLKELQAKGITARASSFYNVTLTAGTTDYEMPSSVLDVYGDAMYIPAGEDVDAASGETTVQSMSQDQWHAQSAKDATGRPTRLFVMRQATPPTVRFWPIPDEAGTVRVQTHRNLADATSGSATLDLEVYWEGYVIHQLAATLAEAKTMPPDKVGRLTGAALAKLREARAMSASRLGTQGVITHGASRRR